MALDVALDLGTAQTRLATSTRGLVLDEPTIAAIDTRSGSVVEIGYGALDVIATTPRHVVAYRPLSQGTTVDFDVTARLIHGLFARAGLGGLSRARVVVAVPTLATAIERRAITQAAVQAGARDVSLVEAPIAAAVGLGLPLEEPVGSAVAVLGAGASELAVLSLGGIVTGAARRVGGADIDTALATALRLTHGVVVPPATLEWCKFTLGQARASRRSASHEVRGRTTNRGRPTAVTVESDLVDGATRDVVASIVTMFQECLGSTPPDLSHDIAKRGITLVGGAAQLSGFDQLLTEATGVVCTVAPEPDRVVIAGLEACLGETIALRALTRRATR